MLRGTSGRLEREHDEVEGTGQRHHLVVGQLEALVQSPDGDAVTGHFGKAGVLDRLVQRLGRLHNGADRGVQGGAWDLAHRPSTKPFRSVRRAAFAPAARSAASRVLVDAADFRAVAAVSPRSLPRWASALTTARRRLRNRPAEQVRRVRLTALEVGHRLRLGN